MSWYCCFSRKSVSSVDGPILQTAPFSGANMWVVLTSWVSMDGSLSISFGSKFQLHVDLLRHTHRHRGLLCWSHTVANIWRMRLRMQFSTNSQSSQSDRQTFVGVRKHSRSFVCSFEYYATLKLWRIYGEWAYECNYPPIRNDRKVIARHS